jgi:transcriptional regulator with XRE-family HTH domain
MFLIVSAPAQPDKSLAATLKHLRTEGGYTQEDLAHKAGLTVAALARIERGQANPTWTTVRRLAGALEISLAAMGEAIEVGIAGSAA